MQPSAVCHRRLERLHALKVVGRRVGPGVEGRGRGPVRREESRGRQRACLGGYVVGERTWAGQQQQVCRGGWRGLRAGGARCLRLASRSRVEYRKLRRELGGGADKFGNGRPSELAAAVNRGGSAAALASASSLLTVCVGACSMSLGSRVEAPRKKKNENKKGEEKETQKRRKETKLLQRAGPATVSSCWRLNRGCQARPSPPANKIWVQSFLAMPRLVCRPVFAPRWTDLAANLESFRHRGHSGAERDRGVDSRAKSQFAANAKDVLQRVLGRCRTRHASCVMREERAGRLLPRFERSQRAPARPPASPPPLTAGRLLPRPLRYHSSSRRPPLGAHFRRVTRRRPDSAPEVSPGVTLRAGSGQRRSWRPGVNRVTARGRRADWPEAASARATCPPSGQMRPRGPAMATRHGGSPPRLRRAPHPAWPRRLDRPRGLTDWPPPSPPPSAQRCRSGAAAGVEIEQVGGRQRASRRGGREFNARQPRRPACRLLSAPRHGTRPRPSLARSPMVRHWARRDDGH